MDADLFELFVSYLPESLEGYAGLAIVTCAFLGAVWPKPSASAHPFWRGLHAVVNAIGLNVRHAKNIPAREKKAGSGIKGKLFRRD